MPNRIIHKRNLTAGAVPTTSSIDVGEIAINVNDGRIFTRKSGSLGDYVVTAVMSEQTSSMSVNSASFAQTASFVNTLNQNVSVFGNLFVYGTASFTQITGSTLQAGTSVLVLNTNNPAIRFGGISVVDSGSFGTSSTGSLFWDSLNNRWIYSNPSGSTYDGGMLISGPRNTSGLGNEVGMDANFVAVGQGGDHIRPGTIYNSGSVTIITGSLTVTQNVSGSFTGSLYGTSSWAENATSTSFSSVSVSSSYTDTASYVNPLNQTVYINGSATIGTGHLLSAPDTLAQGNGNIAAGSASLATGLYTFAGGHYSRTAGGNSVTLGLGSISEGYFTLAGGDVYSKVVSGSYSYDPAGPYIVISGDVTSYTTGTPIAFIHNDDGGNLRSSFISSTSYDSNANQTTVFLQTTPSFNVDTAATDAFFQNNNDINSGHSEGASTRALGAFSHAEGLTTTALGAGSHAEGKQTLAQGEASHAEGNSTQASSDYSHAEGSSTTAQGDYSHAEGENTTALGIGSHAEGYRTDANGLFSHAEGENTTAQGDYSHTEGSNTTANGYAAHAMGYRTTASGDFSLSQGIGTIAVMNGSTAMGMFNIPTSGALFVIGNGIDDINRSNLVTVTTSSVQITGSLIVSGSNTFINIGPAQFTGSVNISGTLSATSIQGTASFANTASYVLNAVSSSFATTAVTASYILNAISSSFATTAATASYYLELLSFNARTGSYTLTLTDAGRVLEMFSGSANTVTVPSSSIVNFSIGTQVVVFQSGSGQTSFTTGSTNVFIRSSGNKLKLSNQYSAATLIKKGQDEWYLSGDITT